MPFAVLNDLKSILRIPLADTSRDVELQIYLDHANATIYGVLGGLTDSVATAYTDRITIDDDTTPAVWTRKWPVLGTPAPALVVNGTTVAGTEYTVTDLGLLTLLNVGVMGYARRRSRQGFPVGTEQVVLTYTAGFAPGDPALAELKLCAIQIAAYNANTTPKVGLQSERIGQYDYTLGTGAIGGASTSGGGFGIPPAAERTLAKWTRIMVATPNAV